VYQITITGIDLYVIRTMYTNITKNELTTVISVALYDNVGNMRSHRLEVIISDTINIASCADCQTATVFV
jgi:hypothetical protein